MIRQCSVFVGGIIVFWRFVVIALLALPSIAHAQSCPDGPVTLESEHQGVKSGFEVLFIPSKTSNGSFFRFSDGVPRDFDKAMPIDAAKLARWPYSFGHKLQNQIVIHYVRGYFLACKDAEHGFAMQIQVPPTEGQRAMLCWGYVFVDDRRILRTGDKGETVSFIQGGTTASPTGNIELTRGLHKFDLALVCGLQFYGMSQMTGIIDTPNESWANTSYRVLVRSGSGLPKVMAPDQMFHKPE